MKKFYQEWNKLIWGGIFFAGVAFLFSLWSKSLTLDLTESRLHTLSEGSKAILKKMPEPVTVKLYYSKTAAAKGSDQIRMFTTHFEYVKELLELFERHSQNKVKLVVVDPRPDTPEEEEAVMSGLRKFQLTDTETYIFGLVVQSESGTKKAIEFFDPSREDQLEYQVAKLLTSLHQGNKKRVGILSGENFGGQEWLFRRAVEELYNVTDVPKDATAISDVDVLLVFGARDLDEKSLKAVDQFLVNGGRVFLAVDPNDEKLSNFSTFWSAWGVEVPAHNYAGDLKYAGMARVNAFSPTQRLLPVFDCNKDCLARVKDVSISSLNHVVMIYPGMIEKTKDKKELTLTPLIQTSEKGNSYTDPGFGMYQPQRLIEDFREGKAPVTLAARLEGKFAAAYPETKVPGEQKSGALILVADQDFLRNQFAFSQNFFAATPINDNVSLLLNGLDMLAGSVDLMNVRSRGKTMRPFTTIQKIQLEADQATVGKVREINASIARFQSELAGLATKANQNNLGVIQSEGIRKQKELQREIARLKSELRNAKRAGREKVEKIGSVLYFLNVGLVPLALGTLYLWVNRKKKSMRIKGGRTYESVDVATSV